LQEAIRAGGSTLRDHRLTDGSLGYFQHSFAVYGRAGKACTRHGTDRKPGADRHSAARCTGTIRRITQSGRSTFYCPKCQK